MGKKCVKCGSHNTGAYLYGMPTIENNGKDYFPPYFKQAKLRHDYFSGHFD